VSINVKKRIRVNGVEYSSLDQMPPELREAYLQAMAPGYPTLHRALDKIVVNGRRIVGRERDERLYDEIMSVVENNGEVTLPSSTEPLLTRRQIKVVAAVIAALAVGAVAILAKTVG
jgi:hypothetical protein